MNSPITLSSILKRLMKLVITSSTCRDKCIAKSQQLVSRRGQLTDRQIDKNSNQMHDVGHNLLIDTSHFTAESPVMTVEVEDFDERISDI